jgi:hypothetical protein
MTPKELFEQTIPALFKAMSADQPDLAKVEAELEFAVPEGGTWTLVLREGQLTGREGAAQAPLVSFALSPRDWIRAQQGQGGLPFGPGGTGGANPFKMSATRFERVKTLKGELIFHVTEDDGAVQSTTICFNRAQGAGPRTEIEIAARELQALSEGKANPQQLFMQGKMRIKGDMAFAMQLGGVMMSP